MLIVKFSSGMSETFFDTCVNWSCVTRCGCRTTSSTLFLQCMIYTAPYVMLLMRAASIARYRVFWAPNGTCLSARCHFTGPKKLSISRIQPPPTCPSNGCCPHQKHYARGRMNHRCIGGFMYKIPPWRSLRVHTSILTCTYTYVSQR